MEKIVIKIEKYLPTEVEPEIFSKELKPKIGKIKIKQPFEKDFSLYVLDWQFNLITLAFVSSYFADIKPFTLNFNEEKKFTEKFSNFSFEIIIRYGE